uniref:CaMBD domain-containing protein n=1 Tax=Trichuris muris TaxID=70415 RepID=A0A5S6QY28_TRIMR
MRRSAEIAVSRDYEDVQADHRGSSETKQLLRQDAVCPNNGSSYAPGESPADTVITVSEGDKEVQNGSQNDLPGEMPLSLLQLKTNLSMDSGLRNRVAATQTLCHSSDCLNDDSSDCNIHTCPVCGRTAILLRRPMSPNSESKNAIYEVSNDYIKLFGSKRLYGNLLSRPAETPIDGVFSQQLLDQSVAVQTMPLMPRVPANYLLPKRKSAYGVLWKDKPNWRQKLRTRKRLFHRRNKICDLSLLFAMIGISLTVLEAELTSSQILSKTSAASFVLRTIIMVSTVVLLILIFAYHATEVKILVNDSEAQDWRVALTWHRTAQAVLELAVCAVCPIPGCVNINWSVLDRSHRRVILTQVPLDTVLSMPMFFRFYLLCRFMALHSRQFRDAATRSIAALNHISVDFAFVLKTLMHENPLRVLIVFTVFFWIIMAWILRQCEQFDTMEDQIKYLNSLWFIIITFMSIGYGDVTPHTYCGRTVAISTGIVGAGVSSALIAVISRKLELSRSEKHVNNFMADSKLARERKHAAAAVLQQTWFIHKYRCLHFPRDEMKLRNHQKKFLAAITEFQRIKWEQRKVADESNALIDVAKLQSDMHEILFEMQRVQEFLVSKVDVLMRQMEKLEKTLLLGAGAQLKQSTVETV